MERSLPSSSVSPFPVSSKPHGLAVKSHDPDLEQGCPEGMGAPEGPPVFWELEYWRRQSHCFPEMPPRAWRVSGETPLLLP